MTITLPPRLEAILLERATREKLEPNVLASRLIEEGLTFEETDRESTIVAIREGLVAMQEGRTRPAEEFFNELAQKYAGQTK